MNLIIDIGNTRAKCAVVAEGRVVAEHCAERFAMRVVDELAAAWPLQRAIVSSTREDAAQVARQVRTRIGHCLEFTPWVSVPVRNAYRSPETLGRDRLAAAVGAAELYPGRDVLIVDLGTALTVDLLTADNTFRGGFISPGLHCRFRSLHDYTARLPLCGPAEVREGVGTTTAEAVTEGVMRGMQYEIEGHIAHMKELYPDLCVIFTGGDAKYFVERIKNTIFANCNLVLCGLNRILAYNASEEYPE